MMIDWDAIIRDLKGNPVKDSDDDAVTLATIASQALIAQLPGDDKLSSKEKVAMFQLALLASQRGVADVEVERVAILKERIAKCYGALIVGRAFEAIEGFPWPADLADLAKYNGKSISAS